jgi:hypothetical protein
MTRSTRGIALGLAALFAAAVLAPTAALADSRQSNKNNWRNLAGIAAAVAGYGLLKGNKTATILGAAGAAYSASRYEKDRHSQSQQNAGRNRYYYRSYGNGGDGNGGYYGGNGGYASRSLGNGHGRGHAYGHYKHGGKGHGKHERDEDDD